MTRLDLIEKFENETELPATWNTGGMGGYTEEYTKWLEQKLVKNLAIPVVSGEYCPICKSDDLVDIDEHYTKCCKCEFSFVG